jgi:uncharacterized protein (UPF0335 family)
MKGEATPAQKRALSRVLLGQLRVARVEQQRQMVKADYLEVMREAHNAGWTVRDLAKVLGTSRSSVGRLLKGEPDDEG